MAQYLARVYQTKLNRSSVVLAEIFEVPSLVKKTIPWESGPITWHDVSYAVWQDASVLLVALFYYENLCVIAGIHCVTGEVEIYFNGKKKGTTYNKTSSTIAFVHCNSFYIPCTGHVLKFDLISRAFDLLKLELTSDYNICALPTLLAVKTAERFGKNAKQVLRLIDRENEATESYDFDSYNALGETMIPISNNQVLIVGGQIANLNRYSCCSSIVLYDFIVGDYEIIADFPYTTGEVWSWAKTGGTVYILWNSYRITTIDLDIGIIKVVFDRAFFEATKGFLFWLKAKQLKLKRMHIKCVLSLIQPEVTEKSYANITRLRDIF